MKWNNELEKELQNEMAKELEYILDYSLRLDELVDIHNKYVNKTGLGIEIYNIDEFNEMFYSTQPLRLLEVTKGVNVAESDWFWEDVGGNLRASYDDELPTNIDDIAEYCVENNEDFGCDEIREYLDTKEDLNAQRLEELEEQEELYNIFVGI